VCVKRRARSSGQQLLAVLGEGSNMSSNVLALPPGAPVRRAVAYGATKGARHAGKHYTPAALGSRGSGVNACPGAGPAVVWRRQSN